MSVLDPVTESALREALPADHGTPQMTQAKRDDQAADLLKKHPGRWVVVRVRPTRQRAQSAAHRVRNGGIKAFRRGFHAEAITTRDGEHQVWAVYRPGLADGPKRELI